MSALVRTATVAYGGMRAFLKKLESPLLLAIRLYWGWQFATDGWGKLHHLDRVGQYFATLNLPMPHQTALFVSSLNLSVEFSWPSAWARASSRWCSSLI